jgi:hypothetical protein
VALGGQFLSGLFRLGYQLYFNVFDAWKILDQHHIHLRQLPGIPANKLVFRMEFAMAFMLAFMRFMMFLIVMFVFFVFMFLFVLVFMLGIRMVVVMMFDIGFH